MAPAAVQLLPKLRLTLCQQARQAWPAEAVALLGGCRTTDGLLVTRCLPLANTCPGPGRFAVAPQQFLDALAALAVDGSAWLGFAHSHPGGLPRPSRADQRELWPHCLQLVVAGGTPASLRLAAFWLEGSRCLELPLQDAVQHGELAR